MKKITIALVAVISAIIACFGMAACSPDEVAKNTYVYDKVTVSYDSTVNEEDKLSDEELNEFGEEYNAELAFADDGTVKIGDTTNYYVQDDDTVYLYSTKADADAGNKEDAMVLKVDGKNLVITIAEDGITVKIIYKKK